MELPPKIQSPTERPEPVLSWPRIDAEPPRARSEPEDRPNDTKTDPLTLRPFPRVAKSKTDTTEPNSAGPARDEVPDVPVLIREPVTDTSELIVVEEAMDVDPAIIENPLTDRSPAKTAPESEERMLLRTNPPLAEISGLKTANDAPQEEETESDPPIDESHATERFDPAKTDPLEDRADPANVAVELAETGLENRPGPPETDRPAATRPGPLAESPDPKLPEHRTDKLEPNEDSAEIDSPPTPTEEPRTDSPDCNTAFEPDTDSP